jgi:hypothetical protein
VHHRFLLMSGSGFPVMLATAALTLGLPMGVPALATSPGASLCAWDLTVAEGQAKSWPSPDASLAS